MSPEKQRLLEAEARTAHWRRWGPYLSERQWGTVREDYSPYGTAWDYFPHDHARARAYRWGEDGIGGISDRHKLICLDRKSTRLNSSHLVISYAVFCLKKKKNTNETRAGDQVHVKYDQPRQDCEHLQDLVA